MPERINQDIRSKNWPSIKARVLATAIASSPTTAGGLIFAFDKLSSGDEKIAATISAGTIVGSIGLGCALINWVINDLRKNPTGSGTF